ncbi:hypothetical protein ACFL6U_13970 [Planctomycetota bacterium]
MQGIQPLTPAVYAPTVSQQRGLRIENAKHALTGIQMSPAAEAVFSPAAQLRQSSRGDSNQKSKSVTAMMETMETILKRIDSLRSYAEMLSGTELTSEGSAQLLSFLRSVSAQIKAFVNMMPSRVDRLASTGITDAALSAIQRSVEDILKAAGSDSDLLSVEGSEAFLESMRQRLGTREEQADVLKQHANRLLVSMQDVLKTLPATMEHNGGLNSVLAMDVAAVVSEGLRREKTALMGISDPGRVAVLLRNDL